MSINWSKKELVARLAKISIPIRELRVGDIVVEDGNALGVATIDTKKWRGKIGVFDEDDNGGIYPADKKIRILPRSSLSKIGPYH